MKDLKKSFYCLTYVKNFEEKLCGFLDLFPPLYVSAFIERQGFIRDVIKPIVMDLSKRLAVIFLKDFHLNKHEKCGVIWKQCTQNKSVGRSTLEEIGLVSAVIYVIVIVLVIFTKILKTLKLNQVKSYLSTKRLYPY